MGVGTSIALIVIGLILRYVASFTVLGISAHILGLILVIVGVVSLVASLVSAASQQAWWHRDRHHVI